jgi:hypothetical protein
MVVLARYSEMDGHCDARKLRVFRLLAGTMAVSRLLIPTAMIRHPWLSIA